MRILILTLSLLCSSAFFCAGKSPCLLKKDNSSIVARSVSPQTMKPYWKSKDFKYIEEQAEDMSLMDKIWSYLKRFFRPVVENKAIGTFMQVIIGICFVGALILLLRGNKQWFWEKSKTENYMSDASFTDDIKAPDFDSLITTAIQNGNYNLAIRFQYQKLLQTLNQKQLIVWHSKKTNRDYVNEMSNSLHATDFKSVTRMYEYIWYGKFEVSETSFGEIRNKFNQLYKNLGA